jgi:hypothetical protein
MNTGRVRLFESRAIGLFCLLVLTVPLVSCNKAPEETVPEIAISESPAVGLTEQERSLIESVEAAGDYVIRYQLSNGELPYRVDVTTGDRDYSPSHIRLIAGTGSLFTACRVTGDTKYCVAGDQALEYYLSRLIEGGEKFRGLCLYSRGYCKIGGAALAVDAIYRRWRATGDTVLDGNELLGVALQLGEHIVWMRNPEGGFFHRLDPFEGTVDEEYYVTYFNGESVLALLELFEMSGDQYWLDQAREVNSYMVQQPITEDHWHSYAFSFLSRLDELSQEDSAYAIRIAEAIVNNESNLEEGHSSISTATKVEALAAIALAFQAQGDPHVWLEQAVNEHAAFVMARQLPSNLCGWDPSDGIERFIGGIYHSCEEPYVRVDALQHWINGAAIYLEYLGYTFPASH